MPRLRVVCDFDDSATEQNVAHELLRQFTNGAGFYFRNAFLEGKMSFREYQEKAFNSTSASLEEMASYACAVAHLRPGISTLINTVQHKQGKFIIASAGLYFYILPVLKAAGHNNVQVAAADCINAPQSDSGDMPRFIYAYPYAHNGCVGDWVICKCRVLQDYEQANPTDDEHRIFIGDGATSDACAASKADLVFARGRLLKQRLQLGLPTIPYETMNEVTDVISKL